MGFFKIILDSDVTSGSILNEESGGAMRGYRVREFADLAGVTVRALHHYDRLAVLRPKRTESDIGCTACAIWNGWSRL
jgi:hypothetical protein